MSVWGSFMGMEDGRFFGNPPKHVNRAQPAGETSITKSDYGKPGWYSSFF
jgi:hypothetical protein